MAPVYKKAGSLEEALELKSKYGTGGVFIAGGTDLLVDMRNNALESQLKAIIDISGLDEINYIKQEGSQISIGAATTLAEIQNSPIIRNNSPVLFKSCQQCANPLIKNAATLGGNLVNASPAADMATPLLVLEAQAVLRSVSGDRVIPLEEFFSGVKETSHNHDEMLTEMRFNEAKKRKFEFLKMGQRNGTSISIVSLSVLFDVGDGVIKDDLKLALGSVAPAPLRAHRTEEALRGVEPSRENIKRAANVLKGEVSPISDVRGSAEYRREMSAVLLQLSFQNLGYGLD